MAALQGPSVGFLMLAFYVIQFFMVVIYKSIWL